MTSGKLCSSSSAPSKVAAIAVSSTLFLLSLLGLASLKGSIALAGSLRHAHNSEQASLITEDSAVGPGATEDEAKPYYIFLQKFPLQNTFRTLFHTEVILCPRDTFSDESFVNDLDGILATLAPSRFSQTNGDGATASLEGGEKAPFAEVPKEKWSAQSSPGCIQLGYGGATCGTPCCGVPHKNKNVAYALNSLDAVISNAMGDYKQLFLYGSTELKNGIDAAFKAVCHGHYGAIEEGGLPTCVSNWAGTDYNPITNNCNTFTSALLKCVFGLTDAKPSLWVSDLMNVKCPTEKGEDGQSDVEKCTIPSGGVVENFEAEEVELEMKSRG